MKEKIAFPINQEAIMEDEMRKEFGNLFDNSEDTEKRLESIMERVKTIVNKEGVELGAYSEEEMHQILDEVEKCKNIKNRKEFVDHLTSAFQPILDLKINNYEKFEEIQRAVFTSSEGFKPVNEILSYGVGENLIHIHLAPAKTMALPEIVSKVRDGLSEIAKTIKNDESIKEVIGSSWIVAKSPKFLEKKFGLIDQGEISDEEYEKYFPEEKQKGVQVNKAVIPREEFLKRYLK